jgi:hypothetical protein
MSDSWDSVTVIRKKTGNAAASKSASAVNAALRSGGAVVTEKKATVLNKAGHHGGIDARKAAKLENETEVRVVLSVGWE